MAPSITIGVVSDTHGLLRPEVVETLRAEGVAHILHAGDVGGPRILPALREIAPVTAVRGNVDHGWPGAEELPLEEAVEIGGHSIFLRHIREAIDLSPSAAGFDAVVFGHTHRPHEERRDGVLWLNPGSIGPRRFDLPVSLAFLTVAPDGLTARFEEIS